MQHVYARVAGFKLAVIPRGPFRMRHAPQPTNAIDVEYLSPDGEFFARVIPDGGGYKSKISQQTPSLYEVVDIECGPDIEHWRIETSKFFCDWPLGYAVVSNNFPSDPSPFDFVGRNREMIFIQTPRKMPDVESMCAAHQTVVRIERSSLSDWIELAYEHDAMPWRQRHEVLSFPDQQVAVTMQAPLEFAPSAISAAQEIARSLVLNTLA